MAPHKRPAPTDGDDDSESSRESSSPPRRVSNKRRRTSDESSVHRDTSSDRADRENASTPPSEISSDSEQDDDDEALLEATQAIEARSRGGIHNEPAEYGILEGVQLKNFMCHEDMSYELGPLINFICGKNGSGKSAILTAIVLCLGGKASATNRGARLQNFIKEGTDHATIICRLKNQGENAYMPDVYGKTIQVERHISRTGSSGFKLKSEKGRIISTRKSDLEEICDHMMLQIENPMAVLSQDQARQFIASSSPVEKYKFFMKGVQLEQLDQDYRLIEEQLDNISAKIAARAPDLKVLKGKADSAANKLALSDRYEAMRDRLRDYRRQLTWAQVTIQEDIRDAYVKELQEADAKIAAAEAKAQELDDAYQEADRLAAATTEKYNAANAAVQHLKDEKNELQGQQQDLKKNYSEAAAEQRQIRDALVSADRTITQKKAAIEQEVQRLAELDGGGAARRINELEEAKEAARRAEEELHHHLDQRKTHVEEIERMQRLESETGEAKRNEERRVNDLENNLKRLVENRNSQDLAFHPRMQELLRALHQEKGFQDAPVGPLGKHVKLLKPEWSSILEKSFGNSLSGFIVTSKRDENLLSDIMRRNQCVLPIFIANNLPLNIEPHLPDPRFDTVLSALDIDNEAVRKQLVISNQIEQSILIQDMTEASKALYSEGTPLRNVKRCYCFSPGSKVKGAVLSYRNGRAAQDPVHEFIGTPRMKTDIDEAIHRQQDVLADCKAQRLRAEHEFRSAQDRHVRAKQALKRHGDRKRELEIAVQEAEDNLERVKEAIRDDSVEGGKLEALRQSLSEAEEQKTIHESSFQDSVIALDDQTKKLREVTQRCNELDERIKEAEGMVDKAQSTAQKAGKKRAHELGEKNRAIAMIDDARADRGTLERKMQEMDEKIASFTDQARQVCERVNLPKGETYESLSKKHEKLSADYRKYQAQVGDRDDIAAEASKSSKAYKAAEREISSLESLQAQLTRTLAERRRRWVLFRGHITARSRAGFIHKLSERGFRGRLHIDHRKKEMDIAVEPDITRRDGTGRSAKTLSGGEKSFSQICLLLSIWDAMGVPIRCLDEFDVFMDAVNRTTSVNLLIDGARHSSGGQFILISPGTKSDIKRAPDVCAIEVAPPERGQTRLVLGPT
ncbi:RecF/RecN/SMC domain-containing protein [Cladophialophora immunda]|nr:RecF/RecN/SMC domain-containing protein [Cladophialophora immunda]